MKVLEVGERWVQVSVQGEAQSLKGSYLLVFSFFYILKDS